MILYFGKKFYSLKSPCLCGCLVCFIGHGDSEGTEGI